MPKRNKTTEQHLETIEYLLAGILLKKEVNINQISRIIGCHNTKIISMYPEKRKAKYKR